jgi:putative transposase
MNRFHRMKILQKFSAVHASVQNVFYRERHLISQEDHWQGRVLALAERRSVMAQSPVGFRALASILDFAR